MSARVRRDGDVVIVGGIRYTLADAIRLGFVPSGVKPARRPGRARASQVYAAAKTDPETPDGDGDELDTETPDEDGDELDPETPDEDGDGEDETEDPVDEGEEGSDERADAGGSEAAGQSERPRTAAPRRRSRSAAGAGAASGE